eukprot:gb/GEZN01018413.1/.p1 GENE.gb/GEZN01018413.1/~~gb/GEZN01018413.1/.p1  ORF type:complete len:219 (-),score=11.65 gb/GEZN01018413.1/:19-675(-)
MLLRALRVSGLTRLTAIPAQLRPSSLSLLRALSTEASTPADALQKSTVSAAEPPLWESEAVRASVSAKHRRIRCSPQKMNEMCRSVRKLNVLEAITQLRFSHKPKAALIANCLRTAAKSGMHNFSMDVNRLLVENVFATQGPIVKTINCHARGKMGIRRRRYCSLRVVLREVAPVKDEKRLGKRGRTHSTIANLTARLKELGKEYASAINFKSTESFK